MSDARAAEARLKAILREMELVVVAFSAGVDSTYLLEVAAATLGEHCIAVTADSPSLSRRSLREARAFCAERGIRHELVATREFDKPDYVANTGRRCYACKAALFDAIESLLAVAEERCVVAVICLGAVTDDFGDVRPGMRAAQERGVRWPLVEAGMSKAMVRECSRERGLATWDQPAEPCLSSRFPYGETVTPAGLVMIEAAEDLLKDLGFSDCRARHHAVGGGKAWLCRIEVPAVEISRAVQVRERLVAGIKALGYAQVALDLGGLKSGGFNAMLSPAELAEGKLS